MATVNRDVKYLNRDFSDIRAKLIEFSQTIFLILTMIFPPHHQDDVYGTSCLCR